MAHSDGTIVGSELYPVAEACGLTAEQVRSCLRRLVSEGMLDRDGRGASATYRSTTAGIAALRLSTLRTRLAYSQDAAGKGWNRKWRLVAFAIPEGQRAARDEFRLSLLDMGGAALQNGVYVSPHDWHRFVLEAANRAGVAEFVVMATSDDLSVGGESDPRILARKLWPIDELAARYEAFVEKYQNVPESLTQHRQRRERIADSVYLPGAFAMATALNEVFLADPLLPPELLPRPWPGRVARDSTGHEAKPRCVPAVGTVETRCAIALMD